MKLKSKLKLFLYIDIIIILALVLYKGYLYFYESDFESLNVSNINVIETQYDNSDTLTFAVFGNVKNSIQVFDKKMIESINENSELDFAISAGDSILDGNEDKYRILNESLRKINIPVLVSVGDNEISDGGALKFYKHFGPYFYSFNLDDNLFIFLDTTGLTSSQWQLNWLEDKLANSKDYKNIFVIMDRSLVKINNSENLKDSEDVYVNNVSFRDSLINIFNENNVEAVFSSGADLYHHVNIDEIDYYNTGGGGGGLIPDSDNSFYHYLVVNASDDEVNYEIVQIENYSNLFIFRFIENLWIHIHSFFYINFVNFILILGFLILFGIILNIIAKNQVDLYRDFNKNHTKIKKDKNLNIVMFTNTYLPFIGGVPISINRLAKGLKNLGHNVYIFAPKYPSTKKEDEDSVIRCKLMFYHIGKEFDYPIVNIFSPEIEKKFKKIDPDIIHLHHPFWMGWKGLHLSKKYNIPVVFTYHTRLEKYAHYFPFFRLIFKGIISHKLIKYFAQRCMAVIAPTNSAKEYLTTIGVNRKIYVMPTAVDIKKIASKNDFKKGEIFDKYKKENQITLCTVSRLSKEKNIYFMIDGLEEVKNNYGKEFKCLIIGDGPEKDNLEKVIEDKNLEAYVELIGAVDPEKINEYYSASDIFIFSSQSETQGMVLLEAMANKCPVVAVRSSGTDDVIENGYNGFKTNPDIEEWSNKVITLMDSKDKLSKMSENAYDYAEKFSIDNMAKKALDVYYESLNDDNVL